ncbi:hypothetical protein BLA24_30955 [Streptomyces cinnamoneus]|uniref:DUF397 domain-containing protein n=1 Tax=Streptomyces cinnamoneus TaxID=53446 RepID=A0A2G1X9M6_STRCJ|nr:DUF397 domain-containing protein [Streptomyces cinnamoneus]PHQ47921.1 hypothetical protein BLA24_30955 [Streptomyces cinnamoneus]PPT15546.1 DUF397 domain-containing protein [Streptomyces cinnamoneus]
MLAHDFGNVRWRKSTYSGNSGECIEVADGHANLVAVRDSKAPYRPALLVHPGAWTEFISGIQAGAFPAAD